MKQPCSYGEFVEAGADLWRLHVWMYRTPWGQRAAHTGKEGYPSLGYQFHCSHSREIFWVSKGFPGAKNDKTIVRYDRFLDSLVEHPEYSEFEYEVYVAPGEDMLLSVNMIVCLSTWCLQRLLLNP